jgi:hypothetical protein
VDYDRLDYANFAIVNKEWYRILTFLEPLQLFRMRWHFRQPDSPSPISGEDLQQMMPQFYLWLEVSRHSTDQYSKKAGRVRKLRPVLICSVIVRDAFYKVGNDRMIYQELVNYMNVLTNRTVREIFCLFEDCAMGNGYFQQS